MATYSRIELRNAVMHDLGVLDAVEAPSAEDAVMVSMRIQSKLEELYEDGLIPFDLDSDAIPAPYLVPLSQVICVLLLGAYGKQDEKQQREIDADKGMRSLRRLKAKPYYGTTAPADYF